MFVLRFVAAIHHAIQHAQGIVYKASRVFPFGFTVEDDDVPSIPIYLRTPWKSLTARLVRSLLIRSNDVGMGS